MKDFFLQNLNQNLEIQTICRTYVDRFNGSTCQFPLHEITIWIRMADKQQFKIWINIESY